MVCPLKAMERSVLSLNAENSSAAHNNNAFLGICLSIITASLV